MLPQGTVGELAFSTTSFMKSTELIEYLSEYDINILWMPLYTGEFKKYEPSGYSGDSNMIMVSGVIGLTGGVDHDERFNRSLQIYWLDEDSVMESQGLMLKNMKELLNKSDSYYEKFQSFENLQEKYNFINENGFTVYGAVVTGPVKELLKLQDADFVQGEQLGEVELWNWDEDE
ncbi:anti-sigma factor C-terminal domain-containing protein [Aquibacillus kalidii]|uniref:anti-sigma factor C-terminal domain-containing protein n=1 Tax=Aquibacillus kalidii TaxID=2762597 RepID=UPI0016450DC3|nr:anti-sigma factor C-terminal domain-containing protein [Aquibacillus kalidii]